MRSFRGEKPASGLRLPARVAVKGEALREARFVVKAGVTVSVQLGAVPLQAPDFSRETLVAGAVAVKRGGGADRVVGLTDAATVDAADVAGHAVPGLLVATFSVIALPPPLPPLAARAQLAVAVMPPQTVTVHRLRAATGFAPTGKLLRCREKLRWGDCSSGE